MGQNAVESLLPIGATCCAYTRTVSNDFLYPSDPRVGKPVLSNYFASFGTTTSQSARLPGKSASEEIVAAGAPGSRSDPACERFTQTTRRPKLAAPATSQALALTKTISSRLVPVSETASA